MNDKHIVELEWHKIGENSLNSFEIDLLWNNLLIFLDELCVVSVQLVSKDYLKHVLEYETEELTKDNSKYIFITTKDGRFIPISNAKYWSKVPDIYFSNPRKDGQPIHVGFVH